MTATVAAAEVAVVIVNYQSYPELHTCLASLECSCPTLDVVVIDHQSDEASAAAVAAAFPRARIVRVPGNEGFAAGVNRGARETRGEYLLLLNPDCVVDYGMCSTLIEWMEEHPRVGAAGPRIRNADGSIQASARRFPDFTTALAGRSSWLTRVFPSNPLSRWNLQTDRIRDAPGAVDWVSGACMMVRRAAFDQVGGMDEGFFLYWEDADFCRRIAQHGWGVVHVPGIGATHIGGRSSRHAADASLVAFHRSAYRLFWKHAGPATRVFAPLVFVALRARLAFMRRVVKRRARRTSA